jgi:hypothetical protein
VLCDGKFVVGRAATSPKLVAREVSDIFLQAFFAYFSARGGHLRRGAQRADECKCKRYG